MWLFNTFSFRRSICALPGWICFISLSSSEHFWSLNFLFLFLQLHLWNASKMMFSSGVILIYWLNCNNCLILMRMCRGELRVTPVSRPWNEKRNNNIDHKTIGKSLKCLLISGIKPSVRKYRNKQDVGTRQSEQILSDGIKWWLRSVPPRKQAINSNSLLFFLFFCH